MQRIRSSQRWPRRMQFKPIPISTYIGENVGTTRTQVLIVELKMASTGCSVP